MESQINLTAASGAVCCACLFDLFKIGILLSIEEWLDEKHNFSSKTASPCSISGRWEFIRGKNVAEGEHMSLGPFQLQWSEMTVSFYDHNINVIQSDLCTDTGLLRACNLQFSPNTYLLLDLTTVLVFLST